MSHEMLPYDRKTLAAIDAFKNPKRGALGKLVDTINKPIETVAEAAFDTRVGEAVAKAIQGTVNLMNDGASWTVRQEAIFEEFRDDGHESVRSFSDIQALELEAIDKTVGYLAAKYKAVGAAEGAATGLAGAAGIAVDIPTLIGLALRACNEYAAYYGFDPSIQAERAFVMNLLSAASSPTQAAKQVAMAEVTKISIMIGKRKTWKELEKLLTVQLIKRIAEALGIRLTKGKLAQVVPILGSAVGAGYNAWYLGQVTEMASFMYRERFLIERYGAEVAVPVRS